LSLVQATFWHVHKTMKSYYWLHYVCLSIHPSAWNNWATTGRIFMKFHIWAFFENLLRQFKFH